MITDLPQNLSTIKRGVYFMECLDRCVAKHELVANYDALHGMKLSQKGLSIDLVIGCAAGRADDEIEGFIEFCCEQIFQRFGI